MPVHKVTLKGVKGFRYGNQKFYSIKQFGKAGAEERAKKQGAAIHISQARARGENIPKSSTQVKMSSRAKGYERRV